MIGALLVVGGAAGAGWAFVAATSRRRPLDIVGALMAPLFVVAALAGGVALLAPQLLR